MAKKKAPAAKAKKPEVKVDPRDERISELEAANALLRDQINWWKRKFGGQAHAITGMGGQQGTG